MECRTIRINRRDQARSDRTADLAKRIRGVSEAGSDGWDDPIVLSTVVIGVIGIAAFIIQQLKSKEPMLDFRDSRSKHHRKAKDPHSFPAAFRRKDKENRRHDQRLKYASADCLNEASG